MKSKQAEHDLQVFAADAKEVVDIILDHNGSLSYISYMYALAFFENIQESAKNNVAAAIPVYKMMLREFKNEIPESYMQRLAA